MKKLLPVLLFLAGSALAAGQGKQASFSQQFGFDAAGFVGRFTFSGSGLTETPYYLTYRKLGDKSNTRLGIGANLGVEGTGTGSATSQNSIQFRIGSERFNDFGKRWRAFYGWDFRFFFTYTASGGPASNNATQLGLGTAPIFGLQWRLNERLSFSTELAYNIFLTLRDSNGRTRYGASTAFSPPVALYAQYDF